MKAVSYNDEFASEDDGYDSPDPEEQELVEQCTAEALVQLQTGDPAVTATREEVQEALWHYYNDVEKVVGYLRGLFSFLLDGLLGCLPGWIADVLLAVQGKRQRRRRKSSSRMLHQGNRRKVSIAKSDLVMFVVGWLFRRVSWLLDGLHDKGMCVCDSGYRQTTPKEKPKTNGLESSNVF